MWQADYKENTMSRRKFVIINENVQNEIMERRKEKWGPEQIVVFIKGPETGTYDVLEMVHLTIGIKITNEKNQWGEIVMFHHDEVTEENVAKAINYLANYQTSVALVPGVPVAARKLNEIEIKSAQKN
jgi:hypothetical protein